MKGILLLLVLNILPLLTALEYSGVLASSGINSFIYGDATSFGITDLKNWSYSSKSLSLSNFDIVKESDIYPLVTQVKVRNNLSNSVLYFKGDVFGMHNSFSVAENIKDSLVHHGLFYCGNKLGMGIVAGFSPTRESGFKSFLYKGISFKLSLGWDFTGDFLAMHSTGYTSPLYKKLETGQVYNGLITLNNRLFSFKYNSVIMNYLSGREYLNRGELGFRNIILEPSFYIQWRKRSDSEFTYNLAVDKQIVSYSFGGSIKLRYINAPLYYTTLYSKIKFGNGSYFSIKHNLEAESCVNQELEGLLSLKLLLTTAKVSCIIPLQSKNKKFSILGTITLN